VDDRIDVTTDLATYRETLDRLDAALVYLLAERFTVTEAIGQLKAEADLPPLDSVREQSQLDRLREIAQAAGLESHRAERIFREITGMVRERHEEIRLSRDENG
jgi:chorismate mutase